MSKLHNFFAAERNKTHQSWHKLENRHELSKSKIELLFRTLAVNYFTITSAGRLSSEGISSLPLLDSPSPYSRRSLF